MAIIPKGQEPVEIKDRMNKLFIKLYGAYPNKVIVSLGKDHKHWAETALDISHKLGYENKNDFLMAYGFTVGKAKMGAPKKIDPEAIIKEIRERNAGNPPFNNIDEIKKAFPDLAPAISSLPKLAKEMFGMPLGQYLIRNGILISRVEVFNNKVAAIDIEAEIEQIKKRFADQIPFKNFSEYAKADPQTVFKKGKVQRRIEEEYETYVAKFLISKGILANKEEIIAQQQEFVPNGSVTKLIDLARTRFENRLPFANMSEFQASAPDLVKELRWYQDRIKFATGLGLVEYLKTQDIIKRPMTWGNYCHSHVIADRAFFGCESLEEIRIPEGIVEIGKKTFAGCKKLKKVELPKTLIVIGEKAFKDCTNLTDINIPVGVSELEPNTFSGCDSLAEKPETHNTL